MHIGIVPGTPQKWQPAGPPWQMECSTGKPLLQRTAVESYSMQGIRSGMTSSLPQARLTLNWGEGYLIRVMAIGFY
jgi:hypothetical protein